MNNRFLKIAMLISGSIFVLAGCSSDNSSFETPPAKGETPANNNPISQNNFTIRANPVDPAFFDPATGKYSTVTSKISVQIGDNNNQLITGSRVINFRTEWGLIDPSCTTDETGTCSVTWRSGSPDTAPSNLENNIIAYSSGGQESFLDTNGNGIFDDGDTFNNAIFQDVQEPFINIDKSFSATAPTFTAGDTIIDTINGKDLTGANAKHDDGDGLFNGPNCAHSTLCSPTISSVTVWEGFTQTLNGGVFYSVGGTVSGLLAGGTLVIQNNLTDEIKITADGSYTYTILGGSSYKITVKDPPPAGQTCTIANSSGTPTADVTDVNITCN